jgi:predicted RNase H-like HicB family nuclease
VHGGDPEKVFKEIQELATWVIETYRKDGKPLPRTIEASSARLNTNWLIQLPGPRRSDP